MKQASVIGLNLILELNPLSYQVQEIYDWFLSFLEHQGISTNQEMQRKHLPIRKSMAFYHQYLPEKIEKKGCLFQGYIDLIRKYLAILKVFLKQKKIEHFSILPLATNLLKFMQIQLC